jgi:hypothetical protein
MPHRGTKGRQEKKKNQPKTQPMYVRTLFGLALFLHVRFRDLLNRIFDCPNRETPKNAQKKIEKGNKLDARPRTTLFITFLSSPYREALNQRNKTSRKKKEAK